jgi:hypothetical protein
VAADAVLQRAPSLTCDLPGDLAPGTYSVVLTLRQGSATLSENSYEIAVASIPAGPRAAP